MGIDRVSLFDLGKWLDVLMKADAPRLVKWLMESRIDIAEFYLNQNIELRIRSMMILRILKTALQHLMMFFIFA